jgi:HSP20 family protein
LRRNADLLDTLIASTTSDLYLDWQRPRGAGEEDLMATIRWTHLDHPFWRPWQDFFRFSGVTPDAWPHAGSRADAPRLNVWSSPEAARVTVQLPGVDPAEIDLSLEGTSLTLRGEREAVELGDNESLHRRERASGRFSRTVELPFEVESDAVSARYEHGVLEVTLPRAESHKPRKIAVALA